MNEMQIRTNIPVSAQAPALPSFGGPPICATGCCPNSVGAECRPHGQDRRQPRPSMVLREIHGELEELNAEAAMLATTIKTNFEALGI